MVEKYGNYEVSLKENFVRLKIDHKNLEYEYLVSEVKDGESAHSKCRLFVEGYIAGKRDVRRSLREILNI